MTATARLEKARRILTMVVADVEHAIKLQAMWARCADKPDVLGAFNHTRDAWGFNIARDAIHMSLMVTLGRIYDTSGGEPASIPSLMRILRDKDVCRLCIETAKDGVIRRPRYSIGEPEPE
jgi:hypothetical protein